MTEILKKIQKTIDNLNGIYEVYTSKLEERRLVLFQKEMPMEYIQYRPRGKKPLYTKESNIIYYEAYINIGKLPVLSI